MAAATSSAVLFYLECHVRETRMHFYKRFREPKLFRDARRLKYDDIVERCTKYPKAASKEAKFRHDYVNQQCALHKVLEPLFLGGNQWDEEMKEKLMMARHDATQALLRVFPGCALITCHFGTSPLMMVCVDSTPCIGDVKALLEACPKCPSMVDLEKRTALHYACVNNRSNVAMIQLLVEAYPEAAGLADKHGRTPLHYACMAGPSSKSKKVRSNFCTTCPDEDDDDPQPADYALYAGFKQVLFQESKTKLCNRDVVALLLKAHPEAAMMKDEEGRTPMHHLCRFGVELHNTNKEKEIDHEGAWERVLNQLGTACPDVVSVQDNDGTTPLQLFEKMGRTRDLQ